jgi:hypothetical protein
LLFGHPGVLDEILEQLTEEIAGMQGNCDVPPGVGMAQGEMGSGLMPLDEPSFQEGLEDLLRSQVRRTAHTICGTAWLKPPVAANAPEPVVRFFQGREMALNCLFGPGDGFVISLPLGKTAVQSRDRNPKALAFVRVRLV